MLFSVMLWMPSWGGMINGLLTLRGAWNKVAEDTVLKFFVVAITFYGMSTFEGPLLSVKSVNALSHYTDWTIAHVHAGALGWVGFMMFGMLYWLFPRLFQAPLWSRKAAEIHFWIATIGILLYIVAIYAAGLTQGLMWRAFTDTGQLAYPDFIETTMKLIPMYWVRVFGGTLYLLGAILCLVNGMMTWARRPKRYEVPVYEAPPLSARYADPAPAPSYLRSTGAHVTNFAYKLERFAAAGWHGRWERLPLVFTVWVAVAVITASLFEIVPLFTIKGNVPTIASVKPLTPLELSGRAIYIAEGCYNCHSQQVRPIYAEVLRYGEYAKPGESVYDHPFQWGSRRIGPDLQRVGGKYPDLWHVRHFENPRSTTPQSIMPPYPWLLSSPLDFAGIPAHMKAMRTLGVPYTEADIAGGAEAARAQAKKVAEAVVTQGGPKGLEDRKVIALVAYMQRLGTDIKNLPPPGEPPAAPPAQAAVDAPAPAAAPAGTH
jgi:cytochrome c oxidase cbb3-type subunit I/II